MVTGDLALGMGSLVLGKSCWSVCCSCLLRNMSGPLRDNMCWFQWYRHDFIYLWETDWFFFVMMKESMVGKEGPRWLTGNMS